MAAQDRKSDDVVIRIRGLVTGFGRKVIHDHLDHCLDAAVDAGPEESRRSVAEFKAITKYL